MKKRVVSGLLCIAMVASMLVGCGGKETSGEESTSKESSESTSEEGSADETTVVRIGYNPASGHVLSALSEDQGFYEEEGISVEYVTFSSNDDAFSSLAAGKVDMLSTYGTNGPLSQIGKGEDVTIVSGYMLTGAMTYVCRPETEFTGVESFVGKIMAGPGLAAHQLTYPLLEAGYDPVTDIEWLNLGSSSDRIQAVASGKADFAMLSTGMDVQAAEAGLKVCCYNSDLMPEYSCCRGLMNTEFIEKNPTTTKKLLKCWIRALQMFNADREYCVGVTAAQIDADEEYVANYMLNEHYQLQVDPTWSIVKRAWDIDKEVGVIKADDSMLEERFNSDIYKAALDEVIEEHYDEDPEYYDSCLAYYEANDVM